jgi:hypothetical protein
MLLKKIYIQQKIRIFLAKDDLIKDKFLRVKNLNIHI